MSKQALLIYLCRVKEVMEPAVARLLEHEKGGMRL
jgi:hypothetical protein